MENKRQKAGAQDLFLVIFRDEKHLTTSENIRYWPQISAVFSNNLHVLGYIKYRKMKIVEKSCKNKLTFSVFSRIPCVSPRGTLKSSQ